MACESVLPNNHNEIVDEVWNVLLNKIVLSMGVKKTEKQRGCWHKKKKLKTTKRRQQGRGKLFQ